MNHRLQIQRIKAFNYVEALFLGPCRLLGDNEFFYYEVSGLKKVFKET